MDAREYDRIADLLIQIRKKYDQLLIENPDLNVTRLQMIARLNFLIENNDLMAKWDDKGWL
jgi:hypothetical protein